MKYLSIIDPAVSADKVEFYLLRPLRAKFRNALFRAHERGTKLWGIAIIALPVVPFVIMSVMIRTAYESDAVSIVHIWAFAISVSSFVVFPRIGWHVFSTTKRHQEIREQLLHKGNYPYWDMVTSKELAFKMILGSDVRPGLNAQLEFMRKPGVVELRRKLKEATGSIKELEDLAPRLLTSIGNSYSTWREQLDPLWQELQAELKTRRRTKAAELALEAKSLRDANRPNA